MNIDRRIANQSREDILSLLSEDEVGSVSSAEEETIPAGNEYLDLEHLELGVQRAEANTPGQHMLPHSAVSDGTWARIMAVFETPVGPN